MKKQAKNYLHSMSPFFKILYYIKKTGRNTKMFNSGHLLMHGIINNFYFLPLHLAFSKFFYEARTYKKFLILDKYLFF